VNSRSQKATDIPRAVKWEYLFGHSRAVRVGNQIYVSGTAATDTSGVIVGQGNPYLQTRQILSNIDMTLRRAGASAKQVVRTRVFTTDISRWEEIARAHAEHFQDVLPATTLVEVTGLLDPEMMVEIEAEAVVR
jgi:enamine deaminase RidA (YjgF/YER057c/UK114 family)